MKIRVLWGNDHSTSLYGVFVREHIVGYRVRAAQEQTSKVLRADTVKRDNILQK